MKILYGIQGTGNGHVSRATQIIGRLKNRGSEVDVIFSGCAEDKVYDASIIKAPGFYKGFTFSVKNGRIRLFNTLKHLSPVQFLVQMDHPIFCTGRYCHRHALAPF